MKEENRMGLLTWLIACVGSISFVNYFPYGLLFWIPYVLHWIKLLKKGYKVEI